MTKQQLNKCTTSQIFQISNNFITQYRNFYSPTYEVSQVVLQKGQANIFSQPPPIYTHPYQGHHTRSSDHPSASNSTSTSGDPRHAVFKSKTKKQKKKKIVLINSKMKTWARAACKQLSYICSGSKHMQTSYDLE